MTFIEKIESILPEIDIETGIMYCGDDFLRRLSGSLSRGR